MNEPSQGVSGHLNQKARILGTGGLWSILIIALAFRIIYAFLVWTPVMKSPEESMAKMYVRSSYLLTSGHGYAQALPGSPAYRDIEVLREEVGFGEVVTPTSGEVISPEGIYPETLHPPGWSLVAAGLHRIFRIPAWFGMQVVGVIVDSLAAVLLYVLVLLGIRNRRVALYSALIYALFPPLAFQAVAMEPMGIMSFFAILSTLFAILAAQAVEKRRQYAFLILCGITIGFGSYFRSDILLLGPFFAIGYWFVDRSVFRSVGKGVFIAAISFLTLVPWAYHNQETIGKWTFTTTALGVNLVNGLGEYPNPWNLGGSDLDRYEDAREAGLPHAFHPDADTLFKNMFWESVREHPAAYAVILARRSVEQPVATPYDWGLEVSKRAGGLSSMRAEGRLLESIPYILERYWSRILSAVFMLLCLLCAVYVAVKKWSTHYQYILILTPALYVALSHIPIHMEPRYLLPGAFGLFVGFAWAIDLTKNRIQSKNEIASDELSYS